MRTLALGALATASVAALVLVPANAPAQAAAGEFTVVLGYMARDGGPPQAQSSFTSSATVQRAGGEHVITAHVRSSRGGRFVVDIETFDAIGRRLDQQWEDGVAFAPGQEREVTVRVRLAGAEQGPFTVKVGIFEPGPIWGALVHWNDSAATFER